MLVISITCRPTHTSTVCTVCNTCKGLSVNNSLTHLLESGDTDDDGEANLIKHSAYYGDNKFADILSSSAGLTTCNIQCLNSTYDEFQLFVDQMNKTNPISIICLQECWTDETSAISLYNLNNYPLIH